MSLFKYIDKEQEALETPIESAKMKFVISVLLYIVFPAFIYYVGIKCNGKFFQVYALCHFIWDVGVCLFYLGIKCMEHLGIKGFQDAYLPPDGIKQLQIEKEADFFLEVYKCVFIVTTVLAITLYF